MESCACVHGHFASQWDAITDGSIISCITKGFLYGDAYGSRSLVLFIIGDIQKWQARTSQQYKHLNPASKGTWTQNESHIARTQECPELHAKVLVGLEL
jgi:hypothetical protein